MPVNLALGHVSTDFLIAALVIYSLSVVAFAGDFAYGRPRRAASAARGQQAQDRAAAMATVGATGATSGADAPADGVLCKSSRYANHPAVVAGRSPAPIARAGPKGPHSRVGFA